MISKMDVSPCSCLAFFQTCQLCYIVPFHITDMMKTHNSGITTARDRFVIDHDRNALLKRIRRFADDKYSDEEIVGKYFNVAGSSSRQYQPGDNSRWNLPEVRKKIADYPHEEHIQGIAYRPFDERYIYYHTDMVERTRTQIMSHFQQQGRNWGLLIVRQLRTFESYGHVFITNRIFDVNLVSTRENVFGFPLYLYPDKSQEGDLIEEEQELRAEPKPNIDETLIGEFANRLGLRYIPSPPGDNQDKRLNNENLTPWIVLDYIYAVLHAPAYRERYEELLRIDFPRVPYPQDREQFLEMVGLGAELRALHLMESDKLNTLITEYPKSGDHLVEGRIAWKEGKAYINKTQYIDNVPQTAWNFHIGGYQPAQKYLKDRKGRKLTAEEIFHYQRIIVALTETARIMEEIDKIVPALWSSHGKRKK